MSVPDVTLSSGTTIPQLGFGVFQIPPEDTAEIVSHALRTGYRHIDTAMLYGNEEAVGQALRESGLDRGEVFITTKVWNDDQGRDTTLKAFDASLERLGLDYVDLYLIHWPCPQQDLYVETWLTLEELYREGRSRAIGVSNFQANHLHRLKSEATIMPAVNQVELHPTFAQADLRAVHAELGVETEAWAPLGQGEEIGSPTVAEIAGRLGRTPAQVILRWHIQLGNIVFPKSVTPSRVDENFQIFDFELSESDMGSISALDSGNRQGPDPDAFG
jgi:2,5-diketo-D-gluconate reductase A